MGPTELVERLKNRFPEATEVRGEVTVVVAPGHFVPAMEYLRFEGDLRFGFLSDITATDWPDLNPRFWVVYHLLSMEHRHRVRVKVGLPPSAPHLASVTRLFAGANWPEREVYDFFGIVFDGHPDLRRIQMPEDWVGHPLRKDEGMGGVNTAYKGAFIPPPDQRGL
ncbi:MAG TPA: NADH-quinone oxidoreductase subunit C [Actinomycetota bacterium]|nr:NADH-quinone oxidoreductase subunit C [Actinomycetota bacterium]